MDLLKALKRTTIISGMGLLALGATQAQASQVVDILGHISATVNAALNITENQALRFGSLHVVCTGGAGACAGGGYLDLGYEGDRTTTVVGGDEIDGLTGQGPAADAPGTGFGSGGNTGTTQTGSQAVGVFTISDGSDGVAGAVVYVSFADLNGNIIDNGYATSYYPNNYVTIAGPGGRKFQVDHFAFQDAGTPGAANAFTTAGTTEADNIYGHPTTLSGGVAKIEVKGRITTTGGAAKDGSTAAHAPLSSPAAARK